MYSKCNLCEFKCNINRNTHMGHCNAGTLPKIASYTLHYSEEPCISGNRGSGTVFFSNCSMSCIYCQNYPISQNGVGNVFTENALADAFIELENRGAHNINLVTPTHYIPSIYNALDSARINGLTLPIVYNTASYESKEVFELIDDIADVFLADIRYSSDQTAMRYSGTMHYVYTVRRNLTAFRRMKDDIYDDAIMKSGLIVRILVLPEMHREAMDNITFIANELGNNTVISIMSQYFPYYRAHKYNEINRQINEIEYNETVEHAEALGFENIYTQYVNTEV